MNSRRGTADEMRRSNALLTNAAIAALAAASPSAGQDVAEAPAAEAVDPLAAGFADPPMSARPRVWWHWMNGNVTQEGIAKDLAWMKRTGLGGVQAFDIDYIGTPTVVEKRLSYMSGEWQNAFRFAASEAERLGLELGIASSPGWSETGGPWVKPQDGVKKLVWSETVVEGGRRFDGVLPAPPVATGPFQDIVLHEAFAAGPKKPHPSFYADVATLAVRVEPLEKLSAPIVKAADGKHLDSVLLNDGLYEASVEIARGTAEAPAVVTMTYAEPQTVRSATVFIPGSADMYTGPTMALRLDMSDDGRDWRKLADITAGLVPTTVGFAAVKGRYFRLIAAPAGGEAPQDKDWVPGYLGYRPGMLAAGKTMKLAELRLSAEPRINHFELKGGFSVAADYYGLDEKTVVDERGTADGKVIDLSRRVRADGTLDWTAPVGRWKLLRFGYSLTGKTNAPAPAEATGLEVDKLDSSAVRSYVETYLDSYRRAVGAELLGGKGIRALLTDSTEVGSFNFTPVLPAEFRRRRGYDPMPWLPAVAGVIVGSRRKSDAFLYDWRKTIAELHAESHYGTIAAIAHGSGLKVYGEALEGWRVSLGDDMDMRRFADVPMAALWTYRRDIGPRSIYLADMRGAASTAHIYGQNLAAAESMTSTRYPWAHAPSDLRRVIDLEFASGINLPVIHTSVHQPLDDRKPGMSMRHIGQFFTRHETWAEMARPWIDYIARSSFLLQQGHFVADVAYFYGEEAPTGPQVQHGYFKNVPVQNAYDFVNPHAVLDVLKVEDGELVAAGGARYKLLQLGGTSERMTLPMLRRIAALVEAGATVAGHPPLGTPAMGEDVPEYGALVRRLWPGGIVAQLGKGRVVRSADIAKILQVSGIAPDFAPVDARSDAEVLFVHRRLADGEIYFLTNRKDRPERFEARFRVIGKQPEIWRADSGTVSPVSYRIHGDHTIVPLSFEADESYFVVFRRPAKTATADVSEGRLMSLGSLGGPWSVAFEPGRGAPASLQLPELLPLSENSDPGIRYFSGIATYSRSFMAPAGYRTGMPLVLDLAKVGDLAEVRLNGRTVGTLWHAPFRIDVAPAMRRGANRLEVRVANLWMNRLIGDAQPGATKVGYTIMPTYSADAPLRPSGLMGPVSLLMPQP